MQNAFEKILVEQKLLSSGDRVLVALSGGADSVALLHLLLGIAERWRLTVEAGHLDHALRAESAGDAEFVRRLCGSRDVPLVVERIEVRAIAEQRGDGLEEVARETRRDFLLRTAQTRDCSVIALGHHRGDQAETVLHRLLRGSGLSGLSAMPFRSGPFIRPLLGFTRKEVHAWLAERRLTWVEDESNRDRTFTRNRIRHDVIPLLESFNPRIEEHLARLGSRIASEEDFWRGEEDRALATLSVKDEEGLCLERPRLLSLHPALRLRVLRRALEQVRGDLRGIGAVHLAAMDGLLLGKRPQTALDLPRAWVGRRYEILRLRREPPPVSGPFDIPIEGPGSYFLPDGSELRVALVTLPQGENSCAVEFDAVQVEFPLRLRSPRPGDRFSPAGCGSKKLKDYFIDAKLDRETRHAQPLVVVDEILWVVGRRRCGGREPLAGRSVLRLEFTSGKGTNRL